MKDSFFFFPNVDLIDLYKTLSTITSTPDQRHTYHYITPHYMKPFFPERVMHGVTQHQHNIETLKKVKVLNFSTVISIELSFISGQTLLLN